MQKRWWHAQRGKDLKGLLEELSMRDNESTENRINQVKIQQRGHVSRHPSMPSVPSLKSDLRQLHHVQLEKRSKPTRARTEVSKQQVCPKVFQQLNGIKKNDNSTKRAFSSQRSSNQRTKNDHDLGEFLPSIIKA